VKEKKRDKNVAGVADPRHPEKESMMNIGGESDKTRVSNETKGNRGKITKRNNDINTG